MPRETKPALFHDEHAHHQQSHEKTTISSDFSEAHIHDGHDHHNEDSLRRLKTAEGHLRGIQRMLEEDAYCIDVIRQLQAVQSALNRISVSILNQHLNTCVITAVRGEDQAERERVLKEISEVFETATKV